MLSFSLSILISSETIGIYGAINMLVGGSCHSESTFDVITPWGGGVLGTFGALLREDGTAGPTRYLLN